MDITQAAARLRPGTAWNYDSINGLRQAEDANPRVSVPSQAELDAVIAKHDYHAKRALEYPSLNDQLDAIWKGGAALEEMRAQILAVKAKYPKPE